MSSSNCPPQLHLTLPTNATSFKRSFEQFGFDLESPVGPEASSSGSSHGSSGASSSSDRNDRNKRARSASSSSGSDESAGTSGSSRSGGVDGSNSFRSDSEDSGPFMTTPPSLNTSPTHLHVVNSFLEPPRLPTPDLPDVEMTDYSLEQVSRPASPPMLSPSSLLQQDDLFRLSLDRLSALESRLSLLRESHSVRSPSPPPTLPPLSLSSTLDSSRSNPATTSFLLSHPEHPPFPESLYHLNLPFPAPRRQVSDDMFVANPDDQANLSHEIHNAEGTRSRDRSTSSSSFPMPHTSQAPGTTSVSEDMASPNPSLGRNHFRRSSASGPEHNSTLFRLRLDSALDLLRSQSPLFSDHDDHPFSTRQEDSNTASAPHIRSQTEEQHSWRGPFNIPSTSSGIFSTTGERSNHPRTTSSFSQESSPSERRPNMSYTDMTSTGRDRGINRANDHNHGPTSTSVGGLMSSSRNTNTHVERQIDLMRSVSHPQNETHSSRPNGSFATRAPIRTEPDRDNPPAVDLDLESIDRGPLSIGDPGSSTRNFGAGRIDLIRGIRHPQNETRNVSANLDRQIDLMRDLRRTQNETRNVGASLDRRIDSMRGVRQIQNEAHSSRLNGLGRSFSDRTPSLFESDPISVNRESVNPTDTGESVSPTRRRTFLSGPSQVRQSYRQSLFESTGGDAMNTSDSSDSEWPRRRPNAPRINLQRHASTNHGILSGWRTVDDESITHRPQPFNRRDTRTASEQPYAPLDLSRLPWSSTIPDLSSDTDPPAPARIHATQPFQTSSSHRVQPRLRDNPTREGSRQPATRTQFLHQFSDDQSDSPTSPNYTHDWTARTRSGGNDQEEGPLNRPTRNYLFGWNTNPLFPLVGARTHRGNSTDPSSSSLGSHRRALSMSSRAVDDDSHAGSFGFTDSPGSTNNRQGHDGSYNFEEDSIDVGVPFSAIGQGHEPSNFWEDSVDVGVPLSAQGTPWFSSSRLAGRNMEPSNSQARTSVFHRNTRILSPPPPILPSRPPRPSFSLPTPEFSPVFDPLSDREDLSPVSQPDPVPSTSLPRPRSSVGQIDLLRSFLTIVEGRDRGSQDSPTRSSQHRSPPEGRESAHRNFDSETHRDTPQQFSLQRFLDVHRMRSRLNRSESTSNDLASSLPPSLPPLRFDYDVLPFSGNAPQAESSFVPSNTQETQSSNSNSAFGIGRSTDGRRTRAPDAVDDILRERLRRRAPQPLSVSRDIWRNAVPHNGGHRTRLSDSDTFAQREIHPETVTNQERNEASRNNTGDPALRGQTAGFAHAIDVLRRDGLSRASQQQFIERFQRETSQESRRSTNWGEIDGVSEGRMFSLSDLSARRRSLLRRDQDALRSDRFIPVAEPSSRLNAGGGNLTTRHRRLSQSPSRDDNVDHERVSPRSRFRGRGIRPRIHLDRALMIEDLSNFETNFGRRSRSFGDYMRDEDFDSSYESLLSLASALGEVKPRAVPEHVITSLPTGLYKDWASTESDKRCPICLDDYMALDPVLKLWDCSHWLHKECLEQWLRGASTCPVCRKRVRDSGGNNYHTSNGDPGPSGSRRDDGADEGSSRNDRQGFPLRSTPWRVL